MLMSSPPSLTYKTSAVRFINHYQGLIFIGQVADLIQRCNHPVHRKSTISNNNPMSGILSRYQLLFQISHIRIFITETLCLAETNAIDNRSMVQLVRNDSILVVEQRLKYSTVRIKCGCI